MGRSEGNTKGIRERKRLMTLILYQLPSLLSREIEKRTTMYSYLISRIDTFSQRRKGYEAPKGIHPYEVKSKAAAGIPFTLEEATLIRDHYFPGEALKDLFKKDAVDELTLTASDCIRIMDHTRY